MDCHYEEDEDDCGYEIFETVEKKGLFEELNYLERNVSQSLSDNLNILCKLMPTYCKKSLT